jgi:hypothetical protein
MVFDFIDDGEDISQALVAQTYHHHLFLSLYFMVFDFIELPVQSVHITTKVMSSNPAHG